MDKGGFDERMRQWLRGRNGADELSSFVCVLALIVVIINIFVRSIFLSVLALLLMGYAWWRMSSKNVDARRRENRVFAELLGPLRPWVRNPAAAVREARSYRHLKCPSCGQRMRVPRGKGNIRVRCPRCQEKFEART